MAYAKKKKVGKNKRAFNIENSLPFIRKTRRARHAKEASDKVNQESSKIISSVIILTMLLVILSTLFATMSTPEKLIKRKVTELATEYYEDYFYENIINYMPTNRTLNDIFNPYASSGFARVQLNQLFVFNDRRHADAAASISKYCDVDKSYFTIYPEPPYGAKNYHIDYDYSCQF